jgi:hypothetical protein
LPPSWLFDERLSAANGAGGDDEKMPLPLISLAQIPGKAEWGLARNLSATQLVMAALGAASHAATARDCEMDGGVKPGHDKRVCVATRMRPKEAGLSINHIPALAMAALACAYSKGEAQAREAMLLSLRRVW